MASPCPIFVRSLGVLAIAALLLASCSKAPNTDAQQKTSPTETGARDDSIPRAPDDPVIVRVNGVDIGESDITLAEEDVGANMPAMPPQQKREYLITYLTDVVLLAQAAQKQKLGDSLEVRRQIAFARNKALMEALLQNSAKAAETDAEMHKVYDEAVKQMSAEQEVRARHILVDTEDEAKAIEVELKGGADFAEEAKKKSRDPGAANGGDLGYFTKDQMVPEFAEVAFKLDKGQISDPIHTQFGWHIIKVEDKRVKPTPSFEEVKAQVQNYIAHRAQAELVEGLRKTATIERLDQPQAPSPMLNPGAPMKK
jgi:peptidyl-prolyl cis-trans isomerase C